MEDILAAGIDVFSTVNVQHLESLNDRVAELTGVRVRETFPDKVLRRADEVVLIDLTPEALIERLQAGKIYPAERIGASLQQLLPDREPGDPARAGTAADGRGGRGQGPTPPGGGAARHPFGRGGGIVAGRGRAGAGADHAHGELPAPGAAGVALRPATRGRAARPALRAPPGSEPTAEQREQLGSLGRLATELDARLLVEEGDDVAEVAGAVAAEHGTTYIIIGQPEPRSGVARPRESLAERLMRTAPGVDVRIVADPRD